MVSHVFGCIFGHVLPCGMPFGDEKSHDMPFEATLLAPSHTVWEQKRKSCGMTSEVKSADLLRFNSVGVEIRGLRPKVVTEGDEVLVHYRSRTNRKRRLSTKTLA